MAPKPADEMAKKRAMEVRIEEMIRHQNEIEKTMQRAAWENTTDATIERRGCARRVAELSRAHQYDLTQRKMQLAGLLSNDVLSWRREIHEKGETADVRKERLSSRARELGARREAARKKNVDECYARQKRLACDDVRLRDSEAVSKVVAVSRVQQMKDKELRLVEEKRVEQAEAVEHLKRLAEADEVERAKIALHLSHEHDVRFVLDDQVALLTKRKEAAKAKQVEEARVELAEWQAAITAERDQAARVKEAARQRGLDVFRFNTTVSGSVERARKAEQAKDLVLLDYQLKKESEADAADEAKVEHEKEMAERYKEYLDGFEKQQTADSDAVDAERLRIENRIWEQKDREQAAQTRARNYLQAQVDAGRQRQMADARALAIEETSHHAEEIRAIKDQQDQLNADEDRKRAAHYQAYLENQSGILQQMRHNDAVRVAEAQRAFLDAKLLAKTEKNHAAVVANQGGRVNTHHPLQSTNWYS